MAMRDQIVCWVGKSVAEENLKNYSIDITGGTENDQGYMSDIVFVETKGTTKDNEPTSLHLVVKHAKNNNHLRKAMPIDEIFENEIYMYQTVFPAFLKFQRAKKATELFDCTPRCLYSSSSGSMEVLVLENLRMKGYQQYDRKKPMNLAHCKAVLQRYGILHAVSFALRQQYAKTFDDLVSKLGDPNSTLFESSNIGNVYDDSFALALEMFEKNGDSDIHEKLRKLLGKGCSTMVKEVLRAMYIEPQSVISHGDCWCNNFLFKYEGGDCNIPSGVSILDWQFSSLRSPVFDLSYFIYAVCSKTELESFEELLQVYYESFAAHLTDLGSDPEEVFPYADLKIHWKKYSLYGFIHMIPALRVILCDKDKAPSLNDCEEGAEFGDVFKLGLLGGEALVYDRLKAVVSHYFDFQEKNI
ncbi:uncharacterized protein [Leptinotarsa decemlineata]|uniref:uncharacterized protein n=1 Tax=Leptinotarsa decemlineata TaxID=7539 RepID=UPI003D304CAA